MAHHRESDPKKIHDVITQPPDAVIIVKFSFFFKYKINGCFESNIDFVSGKCLSGQIQRFGFFCLLYYNYLNFVKL